MLFYALSAARGMEYMARKNYVHHDLAARNCMYVSRFNPPPTYCTISLTTTVMIEFALGGKLQDHINPYILSKIALKVLSRISHQKSGLSDTHKIILLKLKHKNDRCGSNANIVNVNNSQMTLNVLGKTKWLSYLSFLHCWLYTKN